MRTLNVHVITAALVSCVLSLACPGAAQAYQQCPSQPVAQIFQPWGDPGWYELIPDGAIEQRSGAWSLRGGAAFVPGNEPYYVTSPQDRWSLSLAPGGAATSAPTCIGLGHPVLRFFARSTAPAQGTLRIDVLFTDPTGTVRSQQIALLAAGSSWQPTPPIPIVLNSLSLLAPQNVQFRFTAIGGASSVDDVYVDPYGKG
jgi:hypothetical protein